MTTKFCLICTGACCYALVSGCCTCGRAMRCTLLSAIGEMKEAGIRLKTPAQRVGESNTLGTRVHASAAEASVEMAAHATVVIKSRTCWDAGAT